jgi:CRP/FNR family cyclic AMP-dependent transcriptional regulator
MSHSDSSMARRTGQAQGSRRTEPKLSKHERRELVAQLHGYEFFARCSTDDLGALVDAGGPFVIPPNWALMMENTPAHCCYAITDGTARVYLNRVQIAELGPGDIVGEMAMLTGSLRRATVTSSTRLGGVRVDNDQMTTLFEQRPSLLNVLRGAYESRTPEAHRQRLRELLRAGTLTRQPGLATA